MSDRERSRSRERTGDRAEEQSERKPGGGHGENEVGKLFVGNLSYDVTEQELRNTFGRYGTVNDARIILDRETNRPRGFGFVTMSSAAEAEECMRNLQNHDLMGREIRIDFTTPKGQPGPRSGGHGGDRRGGGGYDNGRSGGYDGARGGYDSSRGGYDGGRGGYDNGRGGYDSSRGGYARDSRDAGSASRDGYASKDAGYGAPRESYGGRDAGYASRDSYHGGRDTGYAARDSSRDSGHRDAGYAPREAYAGRDAGYAARDAAPRDAPREGYGYRDAGFAPRDAPRDVSRDGARDYGHAREGGYPAVNDGRSRSRGICYAFQKGTCTRGGDCRFSHDLSAAAPVGGGAGGDYGRY